jgi:PAS domain S-box-containing protein
MEIDSTIIEEICKTEQTNTNGESIKNQLELELEDLNKDQDSDETETDCLINDISKDSKIFKRIIENQLEGILILDFKGKILFANQAIVELIGCDSSDELIGKNSYSYIEKRFHPRIIKDQLLVRIGKSGFINTYQVVTKDGSKIWVEGLGYKTKLHDHNAIVVFVRDITDRIKTWDKLVKLEKKYHAIVDISADGIIYIDQIGKLTYANNSFKKMIGKKDITNSLFRQYLSNESVYLSQQIFVESRKNNEKMENIELELLDIDNVSIPIELSISPVITDNEFSGFVCTIHDITERKKMEEEIKKSEKLKTEFMNIAAHELKSPVTPIKGYLELIISDQDANEKIKKWAQVSLRNAERLLILVNDILDVSRLDNDTMKFDMVKLNTNELLNEIGEEMYPSIEGKNLSFNSNILDDLPPILGDYNRLSQVLRNLFTNAIKFTDEGSISLTTRLDNNHLMIYIEDTGLGIRPEDLKKVFLKFYQAVTSDNRKYEGTGLGLFICREIIRKHKGDITVESIPGKGSKFIINLPVLNR